MIDTDVSVEARFYARWMSVAKVKEILGQIDENAHSTRVELERLLIILQGFLPLAHSSMDLTCPSKYTA